MVEATKTLTLEDRLRNAVDWAIRYEGSTRAAAIIRIGFPIVIWSRIGERLMLHKHMDEPDFFWGAIILMAASLLMCVGYKSRITSLITGLVMTYWYMKHGLIMGEVAWKGLPQYWSPPLFLALTDCGRSLSVDRWLAVRRARAAGEPDPPETGNNLGLRLIAFHVSSIYVWGALDKVDPQWFAGERLDRVWMANYGTSDYPQEWFFPLMLALSAYGTTILEFTLGIGLWLDKWRKYLIPFGIMLHAVFYITLWVNSFSAMMWLCYLAFIPVDRTHGWLDEVFGIRHPEPEKKKKKKKKKKKAKKKSEAESEPESDEVSDEPAPDEPATEEPEGQDED